MRSYRSSSGPFAERPFYTEEDIERICEDELLKAGCMPEKPGAIRIERFIEKRFNVVPHFEEMDTGVLGYTCFGPEGVTSMHIAASLVDSDKVSDERRANSTIAHEAGHGLLHTHLFALSDMTPELFGGDPDVTKAKILCRDLGGDINSKRYDGKWWEHQANMVIGPLLMPRHLVIKAIKPFSEEIGLLKTQEVPDEERNGAILHLSEVFDVNPIVAKIRLDKLRPQQKGQMML